MLDRSMFIKPRNALEGERSSAQPSIPEHLYRACPSCKAAVLSQDLRANLMVCPLCGYHMRMDASRRVKMLLDPGSFEEFDASLATSNPIAFPEYENKLRAAQRTTGRQDGVITGRGTIDGRPVVLFVMDAQFMMGSMGSVVGEKITRAFEYATEHSLPVVGVTVSGGARISDAVMRAVVLAAGAGVAMWAYIQLGGSVTWSL